MSRGTGRANDGDSAAGGVSDEPTLVDPPLARPRADSVTDEVTVRLPPDELAEAVTTGIACEPPLFEELTPISADPTRVLPPRGAPASYRSALMDAVSSEVTTQPNFDTKVREFRDQRRRNVRYRDENRVGAPAARSAVRESDPESGQKMRLFQVLVPVFVGLVFAISGFVWGLARGRAADGAVVGATPEQHAALAASSDAVASGVPIERAIAGQLAAIRALESLPRKQLTARELLALEAGRRTRKERQLWALSLDSPRKMNAETQAALAEQAADPRLAPAILAAFSELDGSTGPDLLYHIATSDSLPARTRELAERTLHAPDVRKRASPALRVVLDLTSAKTCEERAEVLPRVIEHGDERARQWLVPLAVLRPGCGTRGADDCNACLRQSPELTAAIRASEHRPGPVLPKLK